MTDKNTYIFTITFAIILVSLLMYTVILKHNRKYKQYYDLFKSTPASVNTPYHLNHDTKKSNNINKILAILIPTLILLIFIILIVS